jgi:hypothetical protein
LSRHNPRCHNGGATGNINMLAYLWNEVLSDFQLNDFHQDCAIPASLRGSWTPRTVPRLCQNGFRPSFGFRPLVFGFQGCRTCSSLNWADVRAALPARRASGVGNSDQPRHTTYRGRPVWESPTYSAFWSVLGVTCPRLQRLAS